MLSTPIVKIDAQHLGGRYRSPDWRAAQARRLVEEGRLPSPRIHDETTSQLADFYRKRHGSRTEIDLAAVYRSAPHVSEAVRMHELGCHGPPCVLEALVLADEPQDRIASRMRTTTQVVQFYESAFWDIRSRLSDHDFVVNHCIGLQSVGADRQKSACATMKFFAYMTGSESIDLFELAAGAPNRWQYVRDLVLAIGRRARLLLRADILQDGRFADPQTKRALLRLIESLEQTSDTYGDELAPKTKDERIATEFLRKMNGRVPRAPFR